MTETEAATLATARIRSLCGYKYELVRHFGVQTEIRPERQACIPGWVSLTASGWLAIGERYAWDGPSGPTVDTRDFLRGSLVHDALYQLIRSGELDPKYRKDADQELDRICREDGMPFWRRWYVFRGVRWFAGPAAAVGTQKPAEDFEVGPGARG